MGASIMCNTFELSKKTFIVLMILLVVTSASILTAQLPSTVSSRVTKIEAALTAIEQALSKDQLSTAQRRVGEVNTIMKEINDRYKGKFDESDPVYVAMMTRLSVVMKAIADAEGQSNSAKEAEELARKAKEELSAKWIGRFAPYLDAKGAKDLPIGSSLNNLPEDKQAVAKASAREAQALFDEYKNTQFPNGKTFDLESIASTLADRLTYYADIEQSDVKEVSCAPWVDLLAPYVEVGRGSPKYLVLSVTGDLTEIQANETLYKEAKEAFEAYKKADFPHGKTYRLEQIEKLFEQALLEMPGYLAESRKKISDEVERRIDNVINYFETTTAWLKDEKATPPIIMAIDFASLKEGVEDYASKAAKDDVKVAALRSKLQKIQDMDKANRVIWGQRNFQLRDAYKGNDIAQLKETARLAALKDYPNSKIFHVTVTSEDWAVEDVVEFTDTTKTAIARRITRSVRAQVSLKTTSGEVRLLGIYLGQNKSSDGSWQKLEGHSTWEDPISEANIGKFVDK